MIFLKISDFSIEIIQTEKDLIGREKIISSVKKELPPEMVKNGEILEKEQFLSLFNDALLHAYPKPIKDRQLALVVSDKDLELIRFVLPKEKNTDLAKIVADKAQELLKKDLRDFESYYKVINEEAGSAEILFTALGKQTIANYVNLFKNSAMKLEVLTSTSFAMAKLLKDYLPLDEPVLYERIENHLIEYIVYSKKEPLLVSQSRDNVKSMTVATKDFLKKVSEENKLFLKKIIIGGSGAWDIHTEEAAGQLQVSMVKLTEIMDGLLSQAHVLLTTGGESRAIYAECVGLMLVGKDSNCANFAKDLAWVDSWGVTEAKPEIEEKPSISVPVPSLSEPIVEYKRSFVNNLWERKYLMVIVGIVGGLVAALAALSFSGKSGSFLPFPAVPTVTLTPTVLPTVTPTPSIDPKLKRSDLKVSVQNGTDISGYAKEIAEFLEKKGYKNVGKANADKDTYEKTILKVKEEKNNYLTLLLTDLKEKFDLTSSDLLEKESSYDVVLILGKK